MVSVFTCHTWNGVFWKRCVFKINHFWNCFRKRLFSSVFWPFKEHDTRKCIEKRRGKERVWRWLNFHLSLIQGHRDSFENQIWAGFGFMVDSAGKEAQWKIRDVWVSFRINSTSHETRNGVENVSLTTLFTHSF